VVDCVVVAVVGGGEVGGWGRKVTWVIVGRAVDGVTKTKQKNELRTKK
jgi:hypothetical protein